MELDNLLVIRFGPKQLLAIPKLKTALKGQRFSDTITIHLH